MKKIIILSTIFFILPLISYADVINSEWFSKHCPIGQQQVECSFRNKEPFVLDESKNGCQTYEDNPNYEYLVGRESSWGGSKRYCLISEDNKTFLKLSLLVLGATILSLFGLIKLRKKNVSN